MKINLTTVLLAVIIGLSIYAFIEHRKYNNQVGVTAELQVSKDSTTKLKDSVSARLALVSASKDSLSIALDAANVLNGKLTSGANIAITPHPIHDTVTAPTIVHDSIRTAHIEDSTAQGKLEANINVLPAPGPIKLDWNFKINPIIVTVGTVQLKDNKVVFVAHTPYGDTQISSPFATPVTTEPWMSGYADVLLSVFEKEVIIRVGGQLRVPFLSSWYLLGELEQPVGQSTGRLNAGIRKTFKVF